jgi:glutathione synthase/RimK-type ligase-like ATP-grasp enzyme
MYVTVKKMAAPQKIGVLYGRENTFPQALIAKINELGVKSIVAESLTTDAVQMGRATEYRVIIDRISQDVPFYRAFLKHAVLTGTTVINNPFWWTADDKFFNYALASKIGVAVPNTVLLPHKQHPPDITDQSLRNLAYPLNWEAIFSYIGFPAFLKPYSGGGWKNVYHVHSPEEFFTAYNQTGDLCMTLQSAVQFEEYYRCYVVGQKNVRVMPYDPRRPHAERYVKDAVPNPVLIDRIVADALTLCKALGYEMNTVEFAVQDGVPYAIDFLNPAPDADLHSVGPENFDWFVQAMADLAIAKAQEKPKPMKELHWSKFLSDKA